MIVRNERKPKSMMKSLCRLPQTVEVEWLGSETIRVPRGELGKFIEMCLTLGPFKTTQVDLSSRKCLSADGRRQFYREP